MCQSVSCLFVSLSIFISSQRHHHIIKHIEYCILLVQIIFMFLSVSINIAKVVQLCENAFNNYMCYMDQQLHGEHSDFFLIDI